MAAAAAKENRININIFRERGASQSVKSLDAKKKEIE